MKNQKKLNAICKTGLINWIKEQHEKLDDDETRL